MSLSRRNMLAAIGGAATLPFSFDRAWANELAHPALFERSPNTLWLIRERTKEEAVSVFRANDQYIRSEILLLSWLMRDVTDGDKAVWIEPKLFDLLAAVQGALSDVSGTPVPLVLTSGYRTPKHNANIEGAAKSSLHKSGYASDIKIPGVPASAIALAGGFLGCGGVGIYPSFCHLDVGRPRIWAKKTAKAPAHPIKAGEKLSPPESISQQQGEAQ